jgi:subtilisin family serine protease
VKPRAAWRAALTLAAAAAAWVTATPALAQAAGGLFAPERQIMVMVPHAPDHFRPNATYGGGYGGDLARSGRQRLARAIARQYGLALVDDWPMPMAGVDCFIMAVPAGRKSQDMAELVSHDSRVAWSQPVQLYGAQAQGEAHNDPLYLAQPAARLWQLASLHRIATGRGVKVAVIDSGIDANHPDLAGQVVLNRNFVSGRPLVPEQHGTGVAGIIAARADNHEGLAGVAPGAKLLGLRACWQDSRRTNCDSFSLAKALYSAIEDKAEVINMSLSGPDDRLLRQLVGIATSRGETVVAAFDPAKPDGGFPASAPGVIAVADSALAHGRGKVYIAPGRDVPTTQPGGKWFLVNGTSYAAAHVSGLFALARENRSGRVPQLVTERGGMIDACATLARARQHCECDCASGANTSAALHP